MITWTQAFVISEEFPVGKLVIYKIVLVLSFGMYLQSQRDPHLKESTGTSLALSGMELTCLFVLGDLCVRLVFLTSICYTFLDNIKGV